MNYLSLPMFQVMKAKMAYHSQRQAVLAQNVANADTPGYRAMDVQKPDFAKMASQMGVGPNPNLRMAITDSKHIALSGGVSGAFKASERNDTYELNPTGNNVSIEEEMMKVAQNQQEYQKAVSLYSKTVDLLRTAIGRPNGG
jgi:flagellar basal-body rod protein FlgB